MKVESIISIIISIIAGLVSIIALMWNIIRDYRQNRAKLKVRTLMTYRAGSNDDRPEMHLIIKNLSHRPTGIYVIQLMKDNFVIGGNGYRERIPIAFRIGPWDVVKHSFRIELGEFKELTHILMIDIDENRLEIPKGKSIWVSFKRR